MATRVTKKVIREVTREQAEDAMVIVANCTSKLKKIEADMELEKQRVEEKYRDRVQTLIDEMTVPKEELEVWAQKDCPNWEGKSFDLTHGTVGFRTNPPKLEKKKGFTWEAITELLRKHFPDLVRTKEEPNKEAIIAMRNDKEFDKVSDKCYLSVAQDETFFIKTKEEELATT
jgi:phage host-nuclease inhibitor protein Gam